MNVINVTRNTTVVAQEERAITFWSRFKGLLFTNILSCGQEILIRPCASIHTIGMPYCIDILFIDRADRVVKTVVGLKPYRFAGCAGSAYVIEVPTGTIGGTGTQLGDQVMVLK